MFEIHISEKSETTDPPRKPSMGAYCISNAKKLLWAHNHKIKKKISELYPETSSYISWTAGILGNESLDSLLLQALHANGTLNDNTRIELPEYDK